MPIEDAILRENDAQRLRLEALVKRRIDYDRDVGGGWTVTVALAHMAFWDRRAAGLLYRWDVEGALPDPVDEVLLNSTLLPEWKLLAPSHAGQLAVDAARAVDAAIKVLDPDKAAAIVMMGNLFLIDRAAHRREHLDQIEDALEA